MHQKSNQRDVQVYSGLTGTGYNAVLGLSCQDQADRKCTYRSCVLGSGAWYRNTWQYGTVSITQGNYEG